jgi:hypothetical protein
MDRVSPKKNLQQPPKKHQSSLVEGGDRQGFWHGQYKFFSGQWSTSDKVSTPLMVLLLLRVSECFVGNFVAFFDYVPPWYLHTLSFIEEIPDGLCLVHAQFIYLSFYTTLPSWIAPMPYLFNFPLLLAAVREHGNRIHVSGLIGCGYAYNQLNMGNIWHITQIMNIWIVHSAKFY